MFFKFFLKKIKTLLLEFGGLEIYLDSKIRVEDDVQ